MVDIWAEIGLRGIRGFFHAMSFSSDYVLVATRGCSFKDDSLATDRSSVAIRQTASKGSRRNFQLGRDELI